MLKTRLAAALIALAGFGIGAQAAPLDAANVLAVMQRAADWQLAHLGQPSSRPETSDPRGWVVGAFDVGLAALADRSPDLNYAEAVYLQGAQQDWRLGPRLYHADDHVIGQSWIWAYERNHDPEMIAAVKHAFDAILAAPPAGSLDFDTPAAGKEASCQDRWCWSDALFMGPPAWAELARATGDPRYLAYADREFRATVARLFDQQESLFYRDTRFMAQRGPHGEKVFWSRGNGWAYAGLARLIQFLPPDNPERPRYVELFRRMSARLVALQKPDGYWPVSLLAPPEGTPPETSGTGFFTFGLAYGAAAGILAEPRYRAAAERGWAALVKAVEPDGKLGWVQQIGAGPDAVARGDTQLYGVGAFLLAGSAMFDLAHEGRAVTLVLHNPLALARRAARIEIPASLLPRAMTGEWVAAAAGEVAPVQRTERGAVTALDLPARAEIALALRPRLGFDPPFAGVAHASIPVKTDDGYRELPRFVVPPTHVIHDALLPIEGAGWESDRIAYRVYLDKRNAVDIYGKQQPAAILGAIGHEGQPSYHDEADWGMDVWRVGDSLGAGGLGVLRGRMAEQLGDMKRMVASVAASGPVLADLNVECRGWTLDGKPHALAADYTISAGSRLSVVSASAPGTPLIAGFGKYPNTTYFHSEKGAWGYMADWGLQSENGKDVLGAALFYPLAEVARTGDDGRSYYVVFKNPAKARYVFAGAWARDGGGIADLAAFRAFVERTARELSHPVSVAGR